MLAALISLGGYPLFLFHTLDLASLWLHGRARLLNVAAQRTRADLPPQPTRHTPAACPHIYSPFLRDFPGLRWPAAAAHGAARRVTQRHTRHAPPANYAGWAISARRGGRPCPNTAAVGAWSGHSPEPPAPPHSFTRRRPQHAACATQPAPHLAAAHRARRPAPRPPQRPPRTTRAQSPPARLWDVPHTAGALAGRSESPCRRRVPSSLEADQNIRVRPLHALIP